jgi:ActR/RegA family two-component response regulator
MSVVAEQQIVSVASTVAKRKPAVDQRKLTTTIQCLVLSEGSSRREMLSRAANEAGWDTVVCADVAKAWATVQRQRFEMALIDLECAAGNADAFKELAEHVNASQHPLLVVCGQEGNAVEEIWARQLGAWLYLPGVSQTSDVRALCEEALPVVEKMASRSETPQS